jgi:hypothetical protein
MADSHPFSNAGLGMFGGDAAIAKQMSTPEGLSEKLQKAGGGGGASPLALLAAYAVNKLSESSNDGGALGGAPSGPNIFQKITGAMVPEQFRSIGISPAQAGVTQSNMPQSQQSTVTTPQTTIGGYRSFFSAPSIGP